MITALLPAPECRRKSILSKSFNRSQRFMRRYVNEIKQSDNADGPSKGTWLLFQWKGTVLSTIYPSIIGFMAFAAVVVEYADDTGLYLPLGDKLTPILTLVVGQLLSFRTSTAYERWGEGRKTWGRIAMHSRTIVRGLTIGAVKETGTISQERASHFKNLSRLVLGFAIATKNSLRDQQNIVDNELAALIPVHLRNAAVCHGRNEISHEILMAIQAYAVR